MTITEAKEPGAWTPPVDNPTGIHPVGYKLLIRLKKPDVKTRGGIHLPDQHLLVLLANANEGTVIEVGPCAFRDRRTGERYFGAPDVKPGDGVRVNSTGTRFVANKGEESEAWYAVIDDDALIGTLSRAPRDYVPLG